MGDDNRVHIFWDNSNIYISAQKYIAKTDAHIQQRDVRVEFSNLYNLAVFGRKVASANCVGSVPPELDTVWKRIEGQGVKVDKLERGALSGTEQGVDQYLQTYMLRTLADYDPGIAVLLTGDGAGYLDGAGFHADLERMHKRGWGIEVLSWDFACNGRLKAWATGNGVYIPLESYVDNITFVQGARSSTPLKMTGRQTAKTSK